MIKNNFLNLGINKEKYDTFNPNYDSLNRYYIYVLMTRTKFLEKNIYGEP